MHKDQQMGWIETVQAIIATMQANNPGLSIEQLTYATRMMTACCLAISTDASHPERVRAMLTRSGRGELVDRGTLADALLDAPIPDEIRSLLYGAFRMAEAVR